MANFKLGEDELVLDIVADFLAGKVRAQVSPSKHKSLEKVRRFVESHIDGEHTYYGINTGFGRLAQEKIGLAQLETLQVNLVRSHASGVGEPLDADVVRLIILLKAHALALGYSGASPAVVAFLVRMLDKGVLPVIPSKGSVGASGDLAPLAHMALAMIGEGEVIYKGKRISSRAALRSAGLKPVKLGAKDGITLINGTQVMAALSAIAVLRAERLIKAADVAAALSVEGFRGSSAPFDPDIQRVRGQLGQSASAKMIRRLIKGSKIIASHKDCPRVQDPYSLRCIPQVHGAVRDAFYYARDIVSRELNSCTDNPLVFADSGKIVSGGNFHGEPLALAMDTLSIAMAELGSISERRIEQLTNPKSGDLPKMFLTPRPGLNSGYMLPHVVASSLVSENKTLAHPASVDSIPTSGGQEDHVSMGMWAARKALMVIENVEWIGAIEMMAACQAIDLHEKRHSPGAHTKLAYQLVRKYVKFLETDRYLMPEATRLHDALMDGEIIHRMEKAAGKWMV